MMSKTVQKHLLEIILVVMKIWMIDDNTITREIFPYQESSAEYKWEGSINYGSWEVGVENLQRPIGITHS